MKRILLVEDDQSLGSDLRTQLSEEYEVEWVSMKEQAVRQIQKFKWDLVILDINLPDGSGLEIAKQFHHEKLNFLFLTAMGDAETRLSGYELGAKEFIPKPFHLKELLIRVRLALQSRSHQQEIVRGNIRINLTQLSISTPAGIQYPSSTDMQILKLLIDRSPAPLSRDEIIDQVWGVDKNLSHRTIDNAIVRLRQILGPQGEKWIRSVRSVGYQWAESESHE